MNSNKKQKTNIMEKKNPKVIKSFCSQLSKQSYLNKSLKKNLENKDNKDQKLKEEPKIQFNNTIIQNKISNKYIYANDINSRTIKQTTPNKIFYKARMKRLKEVSEKKISTNIYNAISISSIIKNHILLEDKNKNNNRVNHIENYSNINIDPNNKITIIKNIFNRESKPPTKEKTKNPEDMKMKIIKIRNEKKENSISCINKSIRSKKLNKHIRNKFRKKIINRQSLSTYNSIENLENNNNYFVTSNINNKKKNILHCNTTSQNLNGSPKRNNFKERFNISILGNTFKNQFCINLSHSNLNNRFSFLNNCRNENKKINNIKTISVNSDNNYNKVYHNFKKKKNHKQINLIRSMNKLYSPRSITKNKKTSTSENKNRKYFNIFKKNHNEKTINNNNSIKKTIEASNRKNLDKYFYQKIKKINLKNMRSNSINVKLINNPKHKKFKSDIKSDNSLSLMNVKLNKNLYLLKLKNKEKSDEKNLKNKILTAYKNKKMNKDNTNNKFYKNENEFPFFYMAESTHSLNVKEDNVPTIKDKVKIINDYYKTKDCSNEDNKNKLTNYNKFLKKYNTNLKKFDSNKNKDKNIMGFEKDKTTSNTLSKEKSAFFDNIQYNISQNSLIMYSIYILSRYYNYFDKIGLNQIILYDKNDNIIPVLYSNCNCENDSSLLFINNNNKCSKNNNKKNKLDYRVTNNPFICDFKNNLYINFYINNIQANNIHHIEIINYFNNRQKISPCKDIKIYEGKILLYEGTLNSDKPNTILLDNKLNNEKNDKDKHIYSTLCTTSRKNFSLLNSNISTIKAKQKKIEFNYNSPKSNKSIKNDKINILKNNNDNLRKCLFGIDNSQNELIINKHIKSDLDNELNFIKFEDIRIIILSNYGHKEYVGLTGIEFIDNKGKIINIEKAKTIGALPKDLYTIYNDEKEKRIFENVFNGDNNTNDINNMWVTKINNENSSLYYPYIELSFYDKICLSKIKIYNYNDKNNLDICAREILIFFDNKYYGTTILRPGIGETIFGYIKNKSDEESDENEDYSQIIDFPLKNIEINEGYAFEKIKCNKFSSILYKNIYETPYLPCGIIIKFQFNNNYGYNKNNNNFNNYDDIYNKYNIIGLNNIEIYNEKGIDILKDNNYNYKMLSNCEILNDETNENNNNKILLNGTQNENGNNCLFYIFNYPIFISFIKFIPLELNIENNVKDFKIFCDNYIIFEGSMNKDKPSIVYFTADIKLYKNINDDFFIQSFKNRIFKEEKTNKYFSLTLI